MLKLANEIAKVETQVKKKYVHCTCYICCDKKQVLEIEENNGSEDNDKAVNARNCLNPIKKIGKCTLF